MPRSLDTLLAEQERAFAELQEGLRALETLTRAGHQVNPVDGTSTDVDDTLARVHAQQHRLDALSAEALQVALNTVAPR